MLNQLFGIDAVQGLTGDGMAGPGLVGGAFGASECRCAGGNQMDALGVGGAEQGLEQLTTALLGLLLNLMQSGGGLPGLGNGAANPGLGGIAAPAAAPAAGAPAAGIGGAGAAGATAPPVAGKGGFSSPVGGGYKVSSEFGPRNGKLHGGIDLAAPTGTPVMAAKAGTVTVSRTDNTGYGSWIGIKHDDGTETRYGHLSARDVQEGQRVNGGQVIGKVGSTGNSTGPHLHFEVRQNGNPINPRQFMNF